MEELLVQIDGEAQKLAAVACDTEQTEKLRFQGLDHKREV
jgi:hypothetical protein